MTAPTGSMGLIVVGAAGRMGQSLIRTITEVEGGSSGRCHRTPRLRGAWPRRGRTGGTRCERCADQRRTPCRLFAQAEGVLDFTAPAATLEFADLAAQARIVHVIGTTGMDESHEARLNAASRHARIVKSGNMSLGVNLLSVLVRQAARALQAGDWDIEVLEMHHRHKVDAPSGTALLLGQAAADGRGIDLAQHSVRVRDGHTGARDEGSNRIRHPARRVRWWGKHSVIPRRRGRNHRAQPQGHRPLDLRPRCSPRRPLGTAPENRAIIPCSTCLALPANNQTA